MKTSRGNYNYVLFVCATLAVVLTIAILPAGISIIRGIESNCSPMGIIGLDQKNGRVYALVAGGQTYIYGETMETWLPQSPSTPLAFNESAVEIKDGDTVRISVRLKEGSQTNIVVTTPKGTITAPICN